MPALFIAGTDTGVGKTVVSAGLAAAFAATGQRVCVYKPIQTGSLLQTPEDPATVSMLTDGQIETHNTYCFEPPVAPIALPFIENSAGHSAQQLEPICPERIAQTLTELTQCFDWVLVEAAGGVRVPITADFDMRDLARFLGLPTLVVARPNLGTINHTLLTLEALQAKSVKILGVVVSALPEKTDDPAVQSLPKVFQQVLSVPVLAWLPCFTLTSGIFKSAAPTLEPFNALRVNVLKQY